MYASSEVIDWNTLEAWEKKGSKYIWVWAQDQVESLLTQYQPSPISSDEVKKELREIITKVVKNAGMKKLLDISFE